MRYFKKSLFVLLLIILAIVKLSNSVAAINTDAYNPGELTSSETAEITGKTSTLLATIQKIGIVSAAVVLTIIGLKYVFGSLEEKANYKENMIPYVIGCFLLVSATFIPNLVYENLNPRRRSFEEVRDIVEEAMIEARTCPECGYVLETNPEGPWTCPDCGTRCELVL